MLCLFVFVQSQTATRNAKTEIEILQRVNHVSLTPQKKTRRNVLHMMSPLFLTLLPSSIIFSFPFFFISFFSFFSNLCPLLLHDLSSSPAALSH